MYCVYVFQKMEKKKEEMSDTKRPEMTGVVQRCWLRGRYQLKCLKCAEGTERYYDDPEVYLRHARRAHDLSISGLCWRVRDETFRDVRVTAAPPYQESRGVRGGKVVTGRRVEKEEPGRVDEAMDLRREGRDGAEGQEEMSIQVHAEMASSVASREHDVEMRERSESVPVDEESDKSSSKSSSSQMQVRSVRVEEVSGKKDAGMTVASLVEAGKEVYSVREFISHMDMMMAIGDSLREKGRVDVQEMRDKFLEINGGVSPAVAHLLAQSAARAGGWIQE